MNILIIDLNLFLLRISFFVTLRSVFLKETDGILKVLLPKAGDTNQFIRSDVEVAMRNLVENLQPMKAMNAIIIAGVKWVDCFVSGGFLF